MKNAIGVAFAGFLLVVPAFTNCQVYPSKSAALPEMPPGLKPDPSTSRLAFSLNATGFQVYECRKDPADPAGKNKWFLKEPVADLFDEKGQLVGAHGAGPHWTSGIPGDNSKVIGILPAKGRAPSSSFGAIDWLLLEAKGEGSGRFAKVTLIQRLETNGGKAPEGCCSGDGCCKEVRVPYTATYHFYTSLQK